MDILNLDNDIQQLADQSSGRLIELLLSKLDNKRSKPSKSWLEYINYKLDCGKNNNRNYFIIDGNKVIHYKFNEVLHNDNYPSIYYFDSISKEDLIGSDDYQEWYLNGLRHNINGPAVVYENGIKEYWIEGIKYESTYLYLLAVRRYNGL